MGTLMTTPSFQGFPMKQQLIIPRLSADETTFAVVRWSGVPRERLRQALQAAVTAWTRATPDGLAAQQDAGKDFNIGDLSQWDRDPSLHPFLAQQGILALDIDVYCDAAPVYGWIFDDPLVAEPSLNKQFISAGKE
jgi:hypothetical protein